MLVLSRKKGEAINIGNDIKIILVDIKSDHVRIGIEAPSDIDIHRAEIYKAIIKENISAVTKQNVFELMQKLPVKKEAKKS